MLTAFGSYKIWHVIERLGLEGCYGVDLTPTKVASQIGLRPEQHTIGNASYHVLCLRVFCFLCVHFAAARNRCCKKLCDVSI